MRIERFSWSQFSTAELCGQLYFYRYVAKLRRTPTGSLLRGRGPHDAAEQNYIAVLQHGTPLSVNDVRDISAESARVAIATEGVRLDAAYDDTSLSRLPGVLIDESADLAGEYRRAIAPKVDPAHVELKLELAPSTAWPFTFVGVLDVVDTAKLIRDTKTKRKAPAGDVADMTGQLSAYEILYRARFGEPSAGQRIDFIWRTPARREVKSVTQSTTRTTHQLAQFAVRVQRMHQALEAEVYIPAKAGDWICSERWCQFTDICPVFNAGRERVTS